MKYIVCPGIVVSQHDGQRHYISAPELMRLYRVAPENCVVYEEGDPLPIMDESERPVFLFPNAHGNYRLPE